MKVFEEEKKLIEKRVNEIRAIKRDPSKNEKITIVDGAPILDSQKEEYFNLKRMAEILVFGMRQTYAGEYLDLRKNTSLEVLPPMMERFFENLNYNKSKVQTAEDTQRDSLNDTLQTEFDLIQSRIQNIYDAINFNATLPEYQKQSTIDFEKELALLQEMSLLIDNDMTNSEKERYFELRNKTKLPEMSEEVKSQFQNIEVSYENDQEMTQDQEIISSNSNINQETTSIPLGLSSHQYDNSPGTGIGQNGIPNRPGMPNSGANSTSPSQEQEEQADFVYDENGNLISTPETINNTTSRFQDIADNAIDAEFETIPSPEENSPTTDDDDLGEITKVSPYQWIKDHKKQILIGMGVVAISVAVGVALVHFLPAFMASTKATEIAFLSEKMVSNAGLWHLSDAATQLSLHSQSVGLAETISKIAGVTANYSNATGAWTIGGQGLIQFASSAAQAATAAAAKANIFGAISGASAALGVGLLGSSKLVGRKLTPKYKEIKTMIDKMKIAAPSLTEEEQTATAQMVSNEIIASKEISDDERNLLFRKLQQGLKKIQKINKKKAKLAKQEETQPEPIETFENIFDEDFEATPAMAM